MPKVSIMMNCLNGERYLHEALDSVFAQSLQDWEVIFWDNCSNDESGAIAKSYGEKVHYFRSDTVTTLGAARNKAYSKCRGEYIAILDVDDLWLPDKLERQLLLFKMNPDLGMTFSNITFFDEEGDQYETFPFITPKRGRVFGDLLEQNFAGTVSMIYRREALELLPYIFDDKFTMVMDYDLSLRVAYRYELDYVEHPLCKWRMHSGNEQRTKKFSIPKEMKVLMENICNDYPDVKIEYGDQVERVYKYIHGQLALEQWSQGNRSGARNYFRHYLKDPKFLIAYISTGIFSYDFFDRIRVWIIDKLRKYSSR